MCFKITAIFINFSYAVNRNKESIVNERKLWGTTENAVNEQNGQFLAKEWPATSKVVFELIVTVNQQVENFNNKVFENNLF